MGRPEKPLISRDRAVRAALDIIDIQGLDALNLQTVAKRMGVKAPSLYYHFKDKSEILSEVALMVLREVKGPSLERGSWEDMIVELCVSTRRTILRHPNAAPLLLEYFPRSVFLRAYNFWTSRSPYPEDKKLLILDGLEKITYGSALFAASARVKGQPEMPDFDGRSMPALAKAVRANTYDDEQLFVETVRAFLIGLRAYSEIEA